MRPVNNTWNEFVCAAVCLACEQVLLLLLLFLLLLFLLFLLLFAVFSFSFKFITNVVVFVNFSQCFHN